MTMPADSNITSTVNGTSDITNLEDFFIYAKLFILT